MRTGPWLVTVFCLAIGSTTAQQRLVPEARFHVPTGQVRVVDATEDGTLIASGGSMGDVLVREASTGRIRQRFAAGPRPVTALRFSRDGRWLAALSSDLSLWQVGVDRPVARMPAAGERALAFSPDGTLLACLLDPRTAVLRSVPDLRMVQRFTHPQLVNANRLAFAPDGRALAVGERPAVVHVFDVATSARRQRIGTFGNVEGLLFLQDGTLVFATDRGRMRIGTGDVDIPEGLHDLAVGHDELLLCGEGFTERRDLAGRRRSGQASGAVAGVFVGRGEGAPTLVAALDRGMRMSTPDGMDLLVDGHAAAVAALEFDQDGIVVETFDGARFRRDHEGGLTPIASELVNPFITRRASSPDGRWELVTGARYGVVLVEQRTLRQQSLTAGYAADMVWRRDSALAALALVGQRADGQAMRGEVRLFDARGEARGSFSVLHGFPTSIDFARDEQSLYVADGTSLQQVSLEDLQDPRVLQARPIDLRLVRVLDEDRLIGHDGRAVHLLDAKTLKLIATYELLGERIVHAAFDRTSGRLVVALLRDVVVFEVR